MEAMEGVTTVISTVAGIVVGKVDIDPGPEPIHLGKWHQASVELFKTFLLERSQDPTARFHLILTLEE
jgi:hypothetical protein